MCGFHPRTETRGQHDGKASTPGFCRSFGQIPSPEILRPKPVRSQTSSVNVQLFRTSSQRSPLTERNPEAGIEFRTGS